MPANSPLLNSAGRQHAGQHSHSRLPKCLGLVSSGVPPTHQLYNGSICHVPRFLFSNNLFNPAGLSVIPKEIMTELEKRSALKAAAGGGGGASETGVLIDDSVDGDGRNVFVTLPAVLLQIDPTHIDYLESQSEHHAHHHTGVVGGGAGGSGRGHSSAGAAPSSSAAAGTGSGHLYRSIFYINDGTVTSYEPDGRGAWQSSTQSKWLSNEDFDADGMCLCGYVMSLCLLMDGYSFIF